MKKLRKMIIVGAVVLALGATSVSAFAADQTAYTSPAEIVADLTGQTVEDLIAERLDTGSTYGEIAEAAGVLEEFEALMLDLRIARVQDRVDAGRLTQERADAIIAAMEDRLASCDGTCDGTGLGTGLGTGGMMAGAGLGSCSGNQTGSQTNSRSGSGYVGTGSAYGGCGGTCCA